MTEKKLHPSVLQFKEFVKNNPKIIQEVRKGKATWQELYEDWYLLGEDDSRWETIGTVMVQKVTAALNLKVIGCPVLWVWLRKWTQIKCKTILIT